MSKPKFDYIKTPLHKYTFKMSPIRLWVEGQCEGKVLNLYAGYIKLDIDEIRNDLDENAPADYHMDAYDFLTQWSGECFNTIILDPPYAARKSMEMYGGRLNSQFKLVKDAILGVIAPKGKVITLGYHSVSLGKTRNFEVERIALFSHGGAIHDTIATVERLKI